MVGQVVQYEQSGALVDIGGKSSAMLAPAEASMQRVDDLEDFMMIGDHREFQVSPSGVSRALPHAAALPPTFPSPPPSSQRQLVLPQPRRSRSCACAWYMSLVWWCGMRQIISGEDENGQVKLSIRRLEFARAWERVRQIQVFPYTPTPLALSRCVCETRLRDVRCRQWVR